MSFICLFQVKKILSESILPRTIEKLGKVSDGTVIAARKAFDAMERVNNVTIEIIQLATLKNKNQDERAEYLQTETEIKQIQIV